MGEQRGAVWRVLLRFLARVGLMMACWFWGGMVAVPLNARGAAIFDQILVEGNRRIETETVRSYLLIQEGSAVSTEDLDLSLKNLFATGLFADVSFFSYEKSLVVNVVENPMINRIAFEGNLRIRDGVLRRTIRLRPRTVYTRTKVQRDVQNLLGIYRRRGLFAATIEPKIIPKEQNRVDLVFEIKEGHVTYVKHINFIGNFQFRDSLLKKILLTKENRWYYISCPSCFYNSDRLLYDSELIRRFYYRRGYVDFRIISVAAELSLDRRGFFLTFTIEEGDRYKYGNVKFDTDIISLKNYEILKFLQKNSFYNIEEVEDSVHQLTNTLSAMGYELVLAQPLQKRNREKRVVDITYVIHEGPRVFIERIDITGNSRTLDKVIRRELRLVEGDTLHAARLRRSAQRIENMDFFEKVDIHHILSETASDRAFIKVNVEEKSTGELSFGVGWSTTTGAMMEMGVRERNLLGRGQDLYAAITLGQKRAQIDLSFTEPYFLDYELVAGVDVFALQKDLQRESSFSSSTIGGTVRFGFNYNELWQHHFNYTLKRDDIAHVKAAASSAIKRQVGSAVQSSVGQSVTYDTRDSRIHPTEGHVVRLSNDIAGLGGTDQFLRTNLSVAQYFSLASRFVLKCSAEAGHIVGLGKDIRIGQRYFLGGDNLRGFRAAGIGPRDRVTKDALGGNWLAVGTVEMTFPLGLPEALGVKGKVFSDFGTLGSFKGLRSDRIHESTKMRVSAGAGVTWKSPVGPLSLDLSLPLKREAFDQTEVFRFNFGTRF